VDALKGIGHACGHNLIAIAGCAAAIGVAAAFKEHSIPGRVLLLGTPAEEAGGGKSHLVNKGAYDEMEACLM
jgi:metal-dependent amidase/aminoacylase/carboxypeptidase family protein